VLEEDSEGPKRCSGFRPKAGSLELSSDILQDDFDNEIFRYYQPSSADFHKHGKIESAVVLVRADVQISSGDVQKPCVVAAGRVAKSTFERKLRL
jgi:hypothetical protein